MKNQILCIFSTTPTKELAELISQTLVFERLAACVQVGSPVKSTYIWEGKPYCETEYPLLIKASEAMLEKLRGRYMEIHSYDCPEWVVVRAEASAEYAKFVKGADGVVPL
jgi:hypothetical protein